MCVDEHFPTKWNWCARFHTMYMEMNSWSLGLIQICMTVLGLRAIDFPIFLEKLLATRLQSLDIWQKDDWKDKMRP